MLTRFVIEDDPEDPGEPIVRLALEKDQWKRALSNASKTDPSLVVSFLGKTHSGKSTLLGKILELLSEGNALPSTAGDSQMNPTTANINLFSTQVDSNPVFFLDFEGKRAKQTLIGRFQRT